MSEIVLKWLNSDIGLSRPVQHFEADFANGFLLGELLHKHGLLDDFRQRFVDENSYAAQSANFSYLKAALRGPASSLGVKLRDEQVRDIMGGDRGSSLRLLFQLRKGLERAGASTGRAEATRGQEETNAPSIRQPCDAKEEHFFQSRLKPLARTEKRVAYELHTKPFINEQMRQMTRAADGFARDVATKWDESQAFRATRLATMKDSQAAKDKIKTKGHEKWTCNVQRKVDSIGKDLMFEKQMIRREYQRVDRIREHHQQECGYRESDDSQGIAWFERNLQRLGIDTSEHAGSSEASIEAANAKELYEKMHEKLPAKAQLQVESAEKMKQIREVKKDSDLARKEREQRQRKVQVEQQATQARVKQQRSEEELLSWLAKEAMEYRSESMDYDQQQRYKEAVRFQRQTRQEERAEVLQRRSAEATARLVEEAQQEREAMLEEKREKQQMRLRSESSSIDAQDESDEEESFQLDPLTGSWELSRTRTLSRTLACSQKTPQAEAPPVPPEELLASVQEKRTSDYLFARGEWGRHQPSEDDARGFLEGRASQQPAEPPPGPWQSRLGLLVRWLCAPAPVPGAEPDLPFDYLPVFALGGSPAGLGGAGGVAAKIARRLAEEFDLAVVDPATVLEECLALAQAQEPEEEWPILARMRLLGRGFLTALQDSGQQCMRPSSSPSGPRGPTSPCVPIPHEQFAEMLFRKIELLSAPPPKPVEEEEQPDPKKKKSPPKAKAKKEEEEAPPKRPSGIIISGFPTELASYVAWESALRGYSSPLLQIMDSKEDLQVQLGSILSPWWSLQGHIMSEMPEAPLIPCHVEAAEAMQCPMHLLRLSYPDRGALSEALVRQVAEERGRLESQSPQPPSRGGAPGSAPAGKGPGKPVAEESTEPSPAELAKAFACQGYELEQGGMAIALDRAWLYEEAQLLVQAFDEPIGCCHDVSATVAPQPQGDAPTSAPSANGEGESPEDACYRQARELMLRWRGGDPATGQDTEQAAAGAGPDVGVADEDAQGALAEAQTFGEEQPLSRMTSAGALKTTSSGGPAGVMEACQRIPVQARSRMRLQWLDCMSNYFKGVEASLMEAQSRASSYRRELVEMQRNFLDFLQRGDDKGMVMSEFLKTWPASVANLKPSTQDVVERLEDLSDRLWQFADQRRAEAVQERQRLMEGGFWEDQATGCLGLTERLGSLEQRRFQLSLELLSETYNLQPPMHEGPSHPGDMEGLTSLRQLGAWLRCLTEHLIGDPVEVGKPLDEDAEAVCPEEDLRAAMLAEQLPLTRRLQAIEAWTNANLEVMREQLDEVFRRMDDWIRDRVKAENDAIKAAIEEVRSTDWSSALNSNELMRSTRSLIRSPKTNHRSPSAAGAFRKRRREVLATLEARQLEADVYEPRDAEQVPIQSLSSQQLSPLDDSVSLTVSHAGIPLECRWSQQMLRGLLEGLTRRSGGQGAVPESALLEELLARRNETMSLRSKLVPQAWVARTDDAYRALCRGFAAPGWGAAAVDITEVLLALTFHGRPLTWPSLEALELSRKMLEESSSALIETEERITFPDVPVNEAVFVQLPLWDEEEEAKLQEEASESSDNLRRFVFEILSCFEVAARPLSPPPAPLASTAGSLAPKPARPGCGASPSRSRAMSPSDVSLGGGRSTALSARRLFAYLGAAASPTEGLRQAMRLLMPTPPAEGMAEEGVLPPEVRVQDLWTVLFSRGARPAAAVTPAPELADFYRELVPPPAPPEQDAPEQKGKAKAKAVSKKPATPTELTEEADAAPPLPPLEQVAVQMTGPELERHPAVLRGLCSHGGLLCRRRALAALFSPDGPTPPLVTSAAAAEARGLSSLIPAPETQAVAEETPEES